MNAMELVRKLREYPPDIEVKMSVNNQVADIYDITWNVGGTSVWLELDDYPIEKKDDDGTD